MKLHIFILSALCTLPTLADSDFQKLYNQQHATEETTPEQAVKDHTEGSTTVAFEQDELSADLQELIQEETNEKVIKFLAEAEELMVQTTEKLEQHNTSGATIAIPTEIIEKILNAAKEKQKSSGSPQKGNGALMNMLQQMMGDQAASGDKPGDKPSSSTSGGEGMDGASSAANQDASGSDNSTENATRRLPKKSGHSGTALPQEFQKALDAYNKAQDQPN